MKTERRHRKKGARKERNAQRQGKLKQEIKHMAAASANE
jgi:hypothetical protein